MEMQRCRDRCGNSLVHPVQVSGIGKLFAAGGPQQLLACCRAVEAIGRDLWGHSPRANASHFRQGVQIGLQNSGHPDPRADIHLLKWIAESSQTDGSLLKAHTSEESTGVEHQLCTASVKAWLALYE